MNTKRRALLPALLLLTALTPAVVVRAQTTAHASVSDPLTMLPASDAVLVIDHSRILNEAIPRILGNDLTPLAKVFAAGEEFKTKTGIDPRTISRIAVGVRFFNPQVVPDKINKKDFGVVIIGTGDFNPSKFVDFMRSEGKERVHEETYGGQTVYTLDERPKGVTQPKPDVEIPALTVLDANTIALGDLGQVKATIDAKGGNGRLSSDLVALATRNSNALISLAGNVPPNLAANFMPKGQSGNDEADKAFGKFFDALASIKQLYVAVGMTPTGIDALLGARLGSTEQAQSLGDMLIGARQQYAVFIEDKMVRDLINDMKISAEGDEVQLRAELPQTVIAMMLSNARKKETAPAVSTDTKATAKPGQTPAAVTPPKKKTRRSTRKRKG